MLESLNIENIAVIEKTALEFDAGLNVLTGETGAGKSIIIDAINAVLGERTNRELVRSGADSGMVSAFFSNISPESEALLAKFDVPPERDGSLLITRKITADGKSSAKINGRPVTASILKEIGRSLVNIHGQHDSQALLNPEQHYRFIDMLAPSTMFYDSYLASFQELIQIRRKRKALSIDEAEKERLTELLQYQIEELEAANLCVGEKESLLQRRNTISNSEAIRAALQNARDFLEGNEDAPGAFFAFSGACSAIDGGAKYDLNLSNLASKMYDTLYTLEAHKDAIRQQAEQLDFDPDELERVSQRLDLLHRLSAKYGETEQDMLSFLDRAREQLETIVTAQAEVEKLTLLHNEMLKKTVALAEQLSAERKHTAKVFEQHVKAELAFLDMPGVSFQVHFGKGKLGHLGFDEISFFLSTNPGEPLKGLNKIASGGELSRIMLAMKNIIARNDSVGTLIFDEIDTGVSGNASQKIGQKLKSVSRDCQVLCVTHSAQIASFAHRHLLITKQVKGERTYTGVTPLAFDDRVKELARIMGGAHASEALLLSAKEMLNQNLEDE